MSPKIAIIVMAACAIAAVGAGNPPSFDPAPKFEAGAEVHYLSRSVINHEIVVDSLEIAEKVIVRTEAGTTLRVIELDSNGVADVEWRLRYMALSSDQAMPGIDQILDYDSREPGPSHSPLAPLFGQLVQHPAKVRVDRRGQVIGFQAPRIAGTAGPLAALARGFFSREAFEQLPLLVTVGAPSPVTVRSKWSRKTTVELPLGVGSLVLDQDLKVKRINARNHTATIEVKGVMTKGAAQGLVGLGLGLLGHGQAFSVNKGGLDGEYLWDYSAGRLISAETQFKLDTALSTPLGRMQLKQDLSSAVRCVADFERRKNLLDDANAGSLESERRLIGHPGEPQKTGRGKPVPDDPSAEQQ